MKRDIQYITAVWISFIFLCSARSATPRELEVDCRNQLRIIHEALMYYQDATDGELPNQLGELVGDYIAPEILYCPAARSKGETHSGKAGLIDLSSIDGRIKGYKWEFGVDDYTKLDSRGHAYRWMDFKKKQLKTIVGEWVPMVRCEHHTSKEHPEKRLNLAYNGKIYISKLYWECEFTHLIPFQYLTADLIEFAMQPLTSKMRKRSDKATPLMLDLRPYANALPEHPWIWGHWEEEMDEFPSVHSDGLFTNAGIQFDVSGLIQLGGKLSHNMEQSFVIKYFPDESKLIQVPSPFSKIHILGGVIYKSDLGAKVAFLELISKDGMVLSSIPWEYGSDVVDIYQSNNAGRLVKNRYEIVWTEDLMRRGKHSSANLMQMKFNNPIPAQDIAFIRLKAGDHYSSPFILGLTLEP